MFSSTFFLSNFVEKDPGFIVGPISEILGVFINFIFNFVYTITQNSSLGLTIILFTIFIKLLMLPLGYKQQKSMYIMQKIQPEMKAIQAKYGNTKDPETAKKMQMEMSKLYRKYNYNPLSGCLPLLLQLPLFIALYFIMKNTYLFISEIGDIYNQLATLLQSAPNFVDVIVPMAEPLVPNGMTIDVAIVSDLEKVLNKFTPDDWKAIEAAMPSIDISGLLTQKNSIEYFMGLNLTEIVGFKFPNILLVFISAGTTFLSSWLMSRKSKSTDPAMQMQQKIMSIVMPIMMGWITLSIPIGVAIYWIVGNIYQIFQQILLTKYCEKKFAEKPL